VPHGTAVELQFDGEGGIGRIQDFEIHMIQAIRILVGILADRAEKHPAIIEKCK
jgi:hypothetical protein